MNKNVIDCDGEIIYEGDLVYLLDAWAPDYGLKPEHEISVVLGFVEEQVKILTFKGKIRNVNCGDSPYFIEVIKGAHGETFGKLSSW